jgi:hypothetical protein
VNVLWCSDEERERQQAKWKESVSRAVETHVEKVQTRVLNDMETKCNRIMATLERRMELVEEELGHVSCGGWVQSQKGRNGFG